MILNEVVWIILGIILCYNYHIGFAMLGGECYLCSVWFSSSFDKVCLHTVV